MVKEFEFFLISQKGLLFRDNKCLIVKMNTEKDEDVKDNIWDFPGGRIDKDEDYNLAFQREIKEEMGINNFEVISIVDCRFWKYRDGSKSVGGVIYLIENNNDEIVLSSEHTDMQWIAEDETDNYSFVWPHMGEVIKKGFKLYNQLKNSENK